MTNTIYDFTAIDTYGKELNFANLKNKVILIVNTASKCGFTKQYAELEELYKKYHNQGLEILAFPCNQFGEQEPGNDEEIQTFCNLTYHVTFKLMKKIDVNGDNTAPIYRFLKNQAKGLLGSEKIKWNFTKFLISKDGASITRYGSPKKPLRMEEDIIKLLNKEDNKI